ncbi:MAG: photosynthetic complex assembly protein PuhC [Alkalilacustris sp.]
MSAALDTNRRRSHEELRKRDREMIPRILVRAMFLMVLAALALVAYARLTDRPLVAAPPEGIEVVTERIIVLSGDMAGRAMVTDLDGRVIADLPGDQGGFVAGIWRVLQRERMLRRMPDHLPVRLTLYADNRLVVYDDFTGWRAQLVGFGIDNYRTFYNLLDAPTIEAEASGLAPLAD